MTPQQIAVVQRLADAFATVMFNTNKKTMAAEGLQALEDARALLSAPSLEEPEQHEANCATRLDRAWAGPCDCAASQQALPAQNVATDADIEAEVARLHRETDYFKSDRSPSAFFWAGAIFGRGGSATVQRMAQAPQEAQLQEHYQLGYAAGAADQAQEHRHDRAVPVALDEREALDPLAELRKAVAFLDQVKAAPDAEKSGTGAMRDARDWLESAARAALTPTPPAAVSEPADEFNGDTPHLIRCITALLELDTAGALSHRIGGHARTLLSAAASRLATPPAAVSAEPRTAKQRFDACQGEEEADPLERLRFFCALAMRGDDWLDVEPFFDAVRAAMAGKPAGEQSNG